MGRRKTGAPALVAARPWSGSLGLVVVLVTSSLGSLSSLFAQGAGSCRARLLFRNYSQALEGARWWEVGPGESPVGCRPEPPPVSPESREGSRLIYYTE